MGLTTNQREMRYTTARKGIYRESSLYSDEFKELVAAFMSPAANYRDYVRFERAYYLAWTCIHDSISKELLLALPRPVATIRRVRRHLADHYEEPTWSSPGNQCVVEFFHTRVVEALGTNTVHGSIGAESSGSRRIPPSGSRTDHRGVSATDGTVVTFLHYSAREMDVSDDGLAATLSAIEAALKV